MFLTFQGVYARECKAQDCGRVFDPDNGTVTVEGQPPGMYLP